MTQPDDSYLIYSYDQAHRLTGIADALGDHIAYTLDAASNRVKEQASTRPACSAGRVPMPITPSTG